MKLIDVNDYSEKELLKEPTLLSKAMLIEKAKDLISLSIMVENIIEEINKNTKYTKEQKKLLEIVIDKFLEDELPKEKRKEIIAKIGKKEGEYMLAVQEMIRRENKMIFERGESRGKIIGFEEGKRKLKEKLELIVKNLQKKNLDNNFISEVTGLSKEEIEKLK